MAARQQEQRLWPTPGELSRSGPGWVAIEDAEGQVCAVTRRQQTPYDHRRAPMRGDP